MPEHAFDLFARSLARRQSRRSTLATLSGIGGLFAGATRWAGASSGKSEGATAKAARRQNGRATGTPTDLPSTAALTSDMLVAVSAGLPREPVAAAMALVETIVGAEVESAGAAAAELFRRAGIPVVSPDGPVIGAPDDLVFMDAPMYDGHVIDMAIRARGGESFWLADLAGILVSLGLADSDQKPIDSNALAGFLGAIGKSHSDPVEVVVAGTAIRALAAHRGQVFYNGVDNADIDWLQLILTVALFTNDIRRSATAAFSTPSGAIDRGSEQTGITSTANPHSVLFAESGPCDALDKTAQQDVDEAGRGLVKTAVTTALDHAKEGLGSFLGQALGDTADIVSSCVLLLGATLRLDADKTETHFKHKPSETGHNVKITATAHFDALMARKNITCYHLAGVSVPDDQNLAGWPIRFSLDQALGTGEAAPYTTNSPTQFMTTGKYLTPVKADSRKLQDPTPADANGQATIELKPKTEKSPGKGKERSGTVVVTAKLDKKMEGPFKLGDLWSFTAIGEAAGGALTKLLSVLEEILTRINLPSKALGITVKYHGADIYTASAGTTVSGKQYGIGDVYWLVDVYTCEGLDGDWHGEAKIAIDPGLLAQFDANLLGKALSYTSADDKDVKFSLHESAPSFVMNDPVLGAIKLKATFTNRPEPDEHKNGPIGSIALSWVEDGTTWDLVSMCGSGACTPPIGPIQGVDEDKRCGDTGAYFDSTN